MTLCVFVYVGEPLIAIFIIYVRIIMIHKQFDH